MKLRIVFAVVGIMLLAMVATSNAQPIADLFAASAAIGVNMPMGDFADEKEADAKMGFEGGVAAERMFGESVGASAGIRYVRFGLNTSSSDYDANIKTLLFDASGKFLFMPGSAVRPFVTGGVMFGKPKITSEGGGDKETASVDWVFGFHGGGGVLYLINPTTGVFGAMEFNHLATDGAKVEYEENGVKDPQKGEADINLQWVGIRGGVTIFFGGSN